MFIRFKKNRSGTTSVVVVEKLRGRYREIQTVGIAKDESDLSVLRQRGLEWIRRRELELQPELDLFGEERIAMEKEREMTERVLSNIDNILLNGTELILDRVFDRIGFNRIEDVVFRKLVQSRLSFPASKAATVEYLKNYYDEDVDLSKIYRYLDKLNDKHKDLVQDISVRHTMKVLGGHIGVMFYDVTTLYFETDRQDDLRKTGFSKEGRHSNPQIILGLLVSLDGYPLAYCIHEGNKYEGHTMLPVIREFVARYSLDDFIVVADSGLMSSDNINELEAEGCKYIIGSRIKNESEAVKRRILSFAKENGLDGIHFVGRIRTAKNCQKAKEILLHRGFDAVTVARLGASSILETIFQKIIRKSWQFFRYNGCCHLISYRKELKTLCDPLFDSSEDVYPGLYPNWDHSPRSGRNGFIIIGSTPELFKIHVEQVLNTVSGKQEEHRIVFAKSWNEWGEGNYLEPDQKFGKGYLNVLAETLVKEP